MKLLAIETSQNACSIALKNNQKIWVSHEIAPMQQAQIILSSIDSLLQQAKIGIAELDAIAYGSGPGSFTGIRLAVSVAKAFGFAFNIPLIPVSSLAVLAQTAYLKHGWTQLCVAIDARVNEIYSGSYAIRENDLVCHSPDNLYRPENLPEVSDLDWQGIGNAWEVYSTKLPQTLKLVDSSLIPHADALLVLAENKYREGGFVAAIDAEPTYIRNQVASKPKDAV